MKAARFYDRGDIRIEDIPEPVVEPGTVGIEVAWCGICGTDLHEFMEGPIFIPPCGHPHPISGESAPITMGHEFSGVVYAVGAGVDDIKVGQHVVVEPYIVADDVPTGPGDHYHLSKDMKFHRPGRARRWAVRADCGQAPLGAPDLQCHSTGPGRADRAAVRGPPCLHPQRSEGG